MDERWFVHCTNSNFVRMSTWKKKAKLIRYGVMTVGVGGSIVLIGYVARILICALKLKRACTWSWCSSHRTHTDMKDDAYSPVWTWRLISAAWVAMSWKSTLGLSSTKAKKLNRSIKEDQLTLWILIRLSRNITKIQYDVINWRVGVY